MVGKLMVCALRTGCANIAMNDVSASPGNTSDPKSAQERPLVDSDRRDVPVERLPEMCGLIKKGVYNPDLV